MDDQIRGQLFVEQERLQRQVSELRNALRQVGQEMERFARELQYSPELVTFSNAPSPLGNMPAELALGTHQSYEWGISRRVEEAAQMIQDLREQERQLRDVQGRLRVG